MKKAIAVLLLVVFALLALSCAPNKMFYVMHHGGLSSLLGSKKLKTVNFTEESNYQLVYKNLIQHYRSCGGNIEIQPQIYSELGNFEIIYAIQGVEYFLFVEGKQNGPFTDVTLKFEEGSRFNRYGHFDVNKVEEWARGKRQQCL